jgi:glc operon protein GlcG
MRTKQALTLDDVKKIAAAAEAEALAHKWAVSIAIVDDGGHLLWLQRLDGAAATSAMILEGGVPIMVGGDCVGAVGVSGVKSNEDAQIAKAGIAALGL